tara:strand:+ start:494 stop:1726 length:1233 start_codon:yes stop_codon:yes gene_type:complete
MELRDYQKEIVRLGVNVLKEHYFVYLAMEVRTGKTLTSLSICKTLAVSDVLFITKKKAISSIQDDYNLLNPDFNITIINYESLHKIAPTPYCVIICDEAHGMGAYPKPSKRAKDVSFLMRTNDSYVILLSGTPTPESYSQMYHQVYAIPESPFSQYKNFYHFAKEYVNVTQKKIGPTSINDYSDASIDVLDMMEDYTISFTQKEAGFKTQITEEILTVAMHESTHNMVKKLKKERVLQGQIEVVLADTAVKLMSKIHQLYSGTVKFESGNSGVTDWAKARFINGYFQGKKIAIFYKFKKELEAITDIFKDNITNDLQEFKETDKSIALQIVSGREGISLKEAEALVYYNIDFSATSYWQSRDRMTTKDRKYNKIYWVFAENGIEHQIYKTVIKKKDYTLNHFKRDLLTLR